MFEPSQQQVRAVTFVPPEPDSSHNFATSVYQVLDELKIPDNEMRQLGCFLERDLDPELELVHHQEQECLVHYRNWKVDPKNLDKRTLFTTSLYKLLEMWPNLQHLSSKFADLQEDLGY